MRAARSSSKRRTTRDVRETTRYPDASATICDADATVRDRGAPTFEARVTTSSSATRHRARASSRARRSRSPPRHPCNDWHARCIVPSPIATRSGATRSSMHFRTITSLPAVTGQPPACTAREGRMNAESRRKIEMGTRALNFTVTHPDTEPSSAAVVAKLEGLVARANEQATAQRDGFIQVRAASARKSELRRAMLEVPIAHLADVGQVAAREQHELDKMFRFKPGASTFLAFRAAARGMASAAKSAQGGAGQARIVGAGAGRVRPDARPVRRGGGAGERRPHGAPGRHARARDGGTGDRADGPGDGRTKPAAIRAGRAAPGRVARGEPGVQRTPRRNREREAEAGCAGGGCAGEGAPEGGEARPAA